MFWQQMSIKCFSWTSADVKNFFTSNRTHFWFVLPSMSSWLVVILASCWPVVTSSSETLVSSSVMLALPPPFSSRFVTLKSRAAVVVRSSTKWNWEQLSRQHNLARNQCGPERFEVCNQSLRLKRQVSVWFQWAFYILYGKTFDVLLLFSDDCHPHFVWVSWFFLVVENALPCTSCCKRSMLSSVWSESTSKARSLWSWRDCSSRRFSTIPSMRDTSCWMSPTCCKEINAICNLTFAICGESVSPSLSCGEFLRAQVTSP